MSGADGVRIDTRAVGPDPDEWLDVSDGATALWQSRRTGVVVREGQAVRIDVVEAIRERALHAVMNAERPDAAIDADGQRLWSAVADEMIALLSDVTGEPPTVIGEALSAEVWA